MHGLLLNPGRAKSPQSAQLAVTRHPSGHHAAHFQDAGKLAAEMGYTTLGIVFQHDRELVELKEAAIYLDIRPATASSNVVAMRAAKA